LAFFLTNYKLFMFHRLCLAPELLIRRSDGNSNKLFYINDYNLNMTKKKYYRYIKLLNNNYIF
ncbi:hypothetical protein GLOIN_2v1650194, partial [Rhizophagus irregularis DAOM 181602=DAOM 197198]